MTNRLPRPARLVLVGSVIADLMTRVPYLPSRGADVLAGPIVTQPGGGFNVLAAATRLGLPAALCGRIGDGPIGTMLREALAELDVPVLVQGPLPTAARDRLAGGTAQPDGAVDSGASFGMVEPSGERTFVTSPGAEQYLDDEALAAVQWSPDDAIYLSGYDLLYPSTGPAVARWLDGDPPHALLVFDPGPLVTDIPPEVLDPVLAHADVLTLNERELALLGGTGDEGEDLSTLQDSLPDGAVIIGRLGARGCRVHLGREPAVQIAAPTVEVVDTTGAGDAHAGAFVAELAAGHDVLEAARRATVAASLAVTRFRSATGPTRADLDAVLESLV